MDSLDIRFNHFEVNISQILYKCEPKIIVALTKNFRFSRRYWKKNSEEAVADLKTTAIHKKFFDLFSKYKTFEEALSAMKDYQGEFPIGD